MKFIIKKKKNEDGLSLVKKKNEDRLSLLPEEILAHILSLMPTEFAVRTSILSKKWRYNWVLVNKLDFDDIRTNHGKDCLLEFINRALSLKTSKLESFGLKISKWAFPNSTLSKWIGEAIKLNVSELDIQVENLDLRSLSLFTCKSLTQLRLTVCPISIYPPCRALMKCPSLVTLPCLKTLDIYMCPKPVVNVFKLINGCPILENLSLRIIRRDSAEDYCFQIPTLKRLTLAISSSVSDINKVVLNVPNLEYLCVMEHKMNSLFVMKDLSSLVEVKAYCYVINDHLWFELLKGLSRAKNLSSFICHWIPLNYQPSSLFPGFPNVRRLELMGYNRLWSILPDILESCSKLEHFFFTKKHHEGCWNGEPRFVPSCMVTNLKSLNLKYFKGCVCDMTFLKFMLSNSKVLKRITVTFSEHLSLNEEMALGQDIPMFPRASKDCEIHIDGKRVKSRFRGSPLPVVSN